MHELNILLLQEQVINILLKQNVLENLLLEQGIVSKEEYVSKLTEAQTSIADKLKPAVEAIDKVKEILSNIKADQ